MSTGPPRGTRGIASRWREHTGASHGAAFGSSRGDAEPSEDSSRPAWALRLDGVPDCAIADEQRRAPIPTTRERAPEPEATGEEEGEGTAVPGLGVAGGQESRSVGRRRGT